MLLDAMQMTFPNGDTKTMTFEDVVPNAPLDAGDVQPSIGSRELGKTMTSAQRPASARLNSAR